MTKFTINTPVEVDINIEDYLPHDGIREVKINGVEIA